MTQLQLRGVNTSELCFDAPGWSDTSYNYAGCNDNFNRVFHVEGGGVSLITIPVASLTPDASNPEEWRFTAVNEISGVGNTCGDASCSELIMRANNINQEVCIQINNILGVGTKNAEPPEDDDTGGDRFIGTFGYMETVADETAGAPAIGRKAACLYRF